MKRLVCSLGQSPIKFSESILTTDTFRKISSRQIIIGRNKASILGVAKGAGMIYPDLSCATMLAFILTDVNIKAGLLREAAQYSIERSFNSITVDGCASTNDSVIFLASGESRAVSIEKKDKDFRIFSGALSQVCLELAKKIVVDAEGATKFITIEVKGAKSFNQAKMGCFSIANSNLFKTAIYGENNNWGRIIAALGQAGIEVCDNASVKTSSLNKKNIDVVVNLKRGNYSWTVYTCDLTPGYIKINADYS